MDSMDNIERDKRFIDLIREVEYQGMGLEEKESDEKAVGVLAAMTDLSGFPPTYIDWMDEVKAQSSGDEGGE